MQKTPNQKKIIIIGAGLAGLAACAKLGEYGLNPLILEARARCGGRVLIDKRLQIPIGLGANWIHGIDNNPIAALAKQYKIEMSPRQQHRTTLYDEKRIEIPPVEVEQFNLKFTAILNEAKAKANSLKQDVSLSSILSTCIEEEKLSPAERSLYKNKLYFLESYLGANANCLSAKNWDQEEAWPGENCFLAQSYEAIINGLEKQCDIRFNTIVEKINLRNEDIEIVADQETFYADYVIVTLPLGVLKNKLKMFDPPLPASKQTAISHLGMGVLNLAVFKFPSVFWPEDTHALFFSDVDDLSIASFTNLYHFIKQPMLLGYYGGKTAQALENESDDAIIAKTMTTFRNHFGKSVPQPEAFLNTRWSHDPFSYGSYAYLKTGSSAEDLDVMSEPVADRLFFAGEATCGKHFATTHGAYLSGIREAERIYKLATHKM